MVWWKKRDCKMINIYIMAENFESVFVGRKKNKRVRSSHTHTQISNKSNRIGCNNKKLYKLSSSWSNPIWTILSKNKVVITKIERP